MFHYVFVSSLNIFFGYSFVTEVSMFEVTESLCI